MNSMWALLFFALPILGCAYIGWHVWQILPLPTVWRIVVLMFLLMAFSCLFLQFLVGIDQMPMSLGTAIYETGTSSLIIALYLVMMFLVLDIGRLLRLVPREWLHNSWWGTIGVLAFIVVVFVYGNLHYHHKYRQELSLTTAKPLTRPLKLVMMSDLHLGYHNQKGEFMRWVDMVNAEQPDIILIAGDIIDGSMRPLRDQRMADVFRRLNAPVYACLGNHEYYAGRNRDYTPEQFYRDAGIHLLRDSSVTIDGTLTIIGRDDRTNAGRKSVTELARKADMTKYTILLDHQPYHLERAEAAGVDFQFSGHTHYGQVWPVSWITNAIYECAFGSYQRGNTSYYVSSGIGIWGGKFRIGTRSEYVVATLGNRPKKGN